MDFNAISAISLSGMEVERLRIDASAINLANAHNAGINGNTFKPVRIVSATSLFSGFINGTFQQYKPKAVMQQLELAPRLQYEPSHPQADYRGFVTYPAVDSPSEMVQIMTAVRAYEANVIAINSAKSMALKALEIGGSN